mmetsp:Transcript_45429/g.94726  ORF Transcript_45429/g.94726 Transcript_45429/m.94726 type:complete len:269 (+) Transcript_45429:180-986(+)
MGGLILHDTDLRYRWNVAHHAPGRGCGCRDQTRVRSRTQRDGHGRTSRRPVHSNLLSCCRCLLRSLDRLLGNEGTLLSHLRSCCMLLRLQLLHLVIVLELCLILLLLELVLLISQVLLRFLLVELQEQRIRLVLQGRLLLLRGLLKQQQLLVVLLRQLHFSLLNLLVHLQGILALALISHCEQIVGLLLQLLCKNFRPVLQLVIQPARICALLALNGCGIWKTCRKTWRHLWLHWNGRLSSQNHRRWRRHRRHGSPLGPNRYHRSGAP